MLFTDLGLSEPILRAVHKEGYTLATPVQAQAIPHILEGRDVLGCAQTGTGKTAAFALPILNSSPASARRDKRPAQIAMPGALSDARAGQPDCCQLPAYGRNLGLHHTVIFGGVGQQPAGGRACAVASKSSSPRRAGCST